MFMEVKKLKDWVKLFRNKNWAILTNKGFGYYNDESYIIKFDDSLRNDITIANSDVYSLKRHISKLKGITVEFEVIIDANNNYKMLIGNDVFTFFPTTKNIDTDTGNYYFMVEKNTLKVFGNYIKKLDKNELKSQIGIKIKDFNLYFYCTDGFKAAEVVIKNQNFPGTNNYLFVFDCDTFRIFKDDTYFNKVNENTFQMYNDEYFANIHTKGIYIHNVIEFLKLETYKNTKIKKETLDFPFENCLEEKNGNMEYIKLSDYKAKKEKKEAILIETIQMLHLIHLNEFECEFKRNSNNRFIIVNGNETKILKDTFIFPVMTR